MRIGCIICWGGLYFNILHPFIFCLKLSINVLHLDGDWLYLVGWVLNILHSFKVIFSAFSTQISTCMIVIVCCVSEIERAAFISRRMVTLQLGMSSHLSTVLCKYRRIDIHKKC